MAILVFTMRILIATDTYHPFLNGVTTFIDNYIAELKAMNHTVWLVSPKSDVFSLFTPFMCIIDRKNHMIYVQDAPISKEYSITVPIWYPTLSSFISEIKPDIIHTMTEFAISNCTITIGNGLKIPIVHTFHTMLPDYTSYGKFLSPIIETSIKIMQKMIKVMITPANIEEFVTKFKNHDIDMSKCIRIRNGTNIHIDKMKYDAGRDEKDGDIRKQCNISPDDFVLLHVGRISEEKNIKTLLNIVTPFLTNSEKKVKREVKRERKIIFLGDGDTSLLSHINKQQIIIKTVPHNEIHKYYKCADVTISASKSETCGLFALESLSCGTPIIVFNIDSMDHIPDEFKVDSEDAFLKKLILRENMNHSEILKEKEMISNISSNFTMNRCAKEYIKVYESLLK